MRTNPTKLEVLAEAETLGWPLVALRGGVVVVEGEDRWRRIVEGAQAGDLVDARAALGVLAEMQAGRDAARIAPRPACEGDAARELEALEAAALAAARTDVAS